jgi:hypothetical protein
MSSLRSVHAHGKRRDDARASGSSGVASVFYGPAAPLAHGKGSCQVTIDNRQLQALHHVYQSSTSMQAARSILVGQLLSSGIVVRRSGRDVPLTEQFARHLESVWIPFARDVVDSFLQFGFAVVSIEEQTPPPFAGLTARIKRAKVELRRKGPGDRAENDGVAAAASQSFLVNPSGPQAPYERTGHEEEREKGTDDEGPAHDAQPVPVVADVGSYHMSFRMGGRAGYQRVYSVSALSTTSELTVDDDAALFLKTPPDTLGNVNSPVATAFELAHFVSSLTELALKAESVRARMQLVTQPVQKTGASNAPLDGASLFFDEESRQVAADDERADAVESAKQLSLVAQMCTIINKLQGSGQEPAAGGSRVATARPPLPPEVPPRIFSVPKDQQVVPAVRPPEARGDLENVIRVANDAICATLGVPASVVFEGKFSSNSMSQLQLLNTTVQSLAISVNSVLTQCYLVCYGGSSSDVTDELCLLTAPLSSVEEIVSLVGAGVIDMESALPSSLHSLGASSNEIGAALERYRAKAEEGRSIDDASQVTDLAQKRATVDLTNAQVEKTKADAKAALKPKPAASSSSK